MFLVVTRNFPPDIGGIQNLMEGLSNALLNHGPVKVLLTMLIILKVTTKILN